MTFISAGRSIGLAAAYFDAVLHANLSLGDRSRYDATLSNVHRRFVEGQEQLEVDGDVLLFDDIRALDATAEEKSKRVIERIAQAIQSKIDADGDRHVAEAGAMEIALLLGDEQFHNLEAKAMESASGAGSPCFDPGGLPARYGTNISLQDGKMAIHRRVEWLQGEREHEQASVTRLRPVLTSDIVLSLQMERTDRLPARAGAYLAEKVPRVFSGFARSRNYELRAEVTSCCLSTRDSGVATALDKSDASLSARFKNAVVNALMNLFRGRGICFHPIKPRREIELGQTAPRTLNAQEPVSAPEAGSAPAPAPDDPPEAGGGAQREARFGMLGPSLAKAMCLRAHRVDRWREVPPNTRIALRANGEAVERADGTPTVREQFCRVNDQDDGLVQHRSERAAPDDSPFKAIGQLSHEEEIARTRQRFYALIEHNYGADAAAAAFHGIDPSENVPFSADELDTIEATAIAFRGFGAAQDLSQVAVVRIWNSRVMRGNYGHAALAIRGAKKPIEEQPLAPPYNTYHSWWPSHAPVIPTLPVAGSPSRSYKADKQNEMSDHTAAALIAGEYVPQPRQKTFGPDGQKKAGISANKVYLPLFGDNSLDDRTGASRPCLFGLSATRMRRAWGDVVRGKFILWSEDRNCSGATMTMLAAGGAEIFARKPKVRRGGALPGDANRFAIRTATEIDRLNAAADRLIALHCSEHRGSAEISLKEAWTRYVDAGNTGLGELFNDRLIESDDPLALMRAAKHLIDNERMLESRPYALAVLCGLRNRLCELSRADGRTRVNWQMPSGVPALAAADDQQPDVAVL